MNPYETTRILDEYLLFHYGTPDQILSGWLDTLEAPTQALHFPVRTVTELIDLSELPERFTALDLGCAVGRSALEMTQIVDALNGKIYVGQVTALDFSHALIQAAREISEKKTILGTRHEEGMRFTEVTLELPSGVIPEHVTWIQGDAHQLPHEWKDFDVVHAANLLCRMHQPQMLLQRFPDLVRPGGQLLLTTPCTWLEEFTPKEHWPHGSTLDWLQTLLSKDFHLEKQVEMPFLIREHARKFQWSVALGTRWRRKHP